MEAAKNIFPHLTTT